MSDDIIAFSNSLMSIGGPNSDLLGPWPDHAWGGLKHHESPLQIQSIKCIASDFQLWRSRLASQSVMHVPDDKQPCSRPCGSSVGRHLKTLDSFSARHWALLLRAEPNGLPTNDMAKLEKEVPSTVGERARDEAPAGSQVSTVQPPAFPPRRIFLVVSCSLIASSSPCYCLESGSWIN
jgi:hypothetical protein